MAPMPNLLCGKCGANLLLVGTAHRCVMPPVYKPISSLPDMPPVAAPAGLSNASSGEQEGLALLPDAPPDVGPSTYRYRDPEARRAYMRGYMARKRAASKALA